MVLAMATRAGGSLDARSRRHGWSLWRVVTTPSGRRLAGALDLPHAVELGRKSPVVQYDPEYSWSVKPFGEQHPIRGTFDDPRISTRHIDSPGTGSESFHDGVDVVAPDGTAVYAVEGGLVHIRPNRPTDVAVISWLGRSRSRVTFGYWHIQPVVKNRQVVQEHQLLGHILAGYGHVHFDERLGKKYVNPLKRGRLTPYCDHGRPVIVSASSYRGGQYQALGEGSLSGRVGLVVDAFDRPPMRTPWPLVELTPSLIRWKLVDGLGNVVVPVHTVVNFSRFYTEPLTSVYAPGTLQNGPHQRGVYNFWLARRFDTTKLANGTYSLVVSASDIRGNRSVRTFGLEVTN
jgi:hypothetical protein